MVFNLPVLLTWVRIALIPLMIFLFYLQQPWASLATAVVFALAGITDWADGYLARLWQQESRFGAFLDPVADKLIVAVALILIVEREADFWVTLATTVIISREIVVSALREWMAEMGARKSVAVSMIGKVKTTAQMVSIPLCLYHAPIGSFNTQFHGTWLMYVAAALTLWSMIYYLRMAWPHLKEKSGER